MSQADGKRRHIRKIAAWPAWVRLHGSARFAKGHTKNVSRGGAYVVVPLDGACSEGDEVDYVLGIRAEAGEHIVFQAVNGEAQVVRVEKTAEGLALRFAEEKDIT